MKNMQKLDIDLGSKMSEPSPMTSGHRDVYYPSFIIDEEKPLDLPDEGVMLVRYTKTGTSSSHRPGEKERYSCTLEVKRILGVKGTAPEKPKKTEEMIDDTMAEIMDRKNKSKDDEEDY